MSLHRMHASHADMPTATRTAAAPSAGSAGPSGTNGVTAQAATASIEGDGQASPPAVTEILKAFFDAQEQRRSHWAEFDQALSSIVSSSQAAPSDGLTVHHGLSSDEPTDATSPSTQQGRTCQGCSAQSHSAFPLTTADLPRILSLVTAGLLDASHRVRTCSTELRSRQQEDLAAVIDGVQDLENDVLRNVVRIETARRDAQRDHHDEVEQCAALIVSRRREIEEACAEIRAELTERTLEGGE